VGLGLRLEHRRGNSKRHPRLFGAALSLFLAVRNLKLAYAYATAGRRDRAREVVAGAAVSGRGPRFRMYR
jgi:hypothetical protein